MRQNLNIFHETVLSWKSIAACMTPPQDNKYSHEMKPENNELI